MNKVAILTQGIPDAAVQRALRALELVIQLLQAQVVALEARVKALEP